MSAHYKHHPGDINHSSSLQRFNHLDEDYELFSLINPPILDDGDPKSDTIHAWLMQVRERLQASSGADEPPTPSTKNENTKEQNLVSKLPVRSTEANEFDSWLQQDTEVRKLLIEAPQQVPNETRHYRQTRRRIRSNSKAREHNCRLEFEKERRREARRGVDGRYSSGETRPLPRRSRCAENETSKLDVLQKFKSSLIGSQSMLVSSTSHALITHLTWRS